MKLERHPATEAIWAWLEQGEGKDRSDEQQEKIRSTLLKLDRDLLALDGGWPVPADLTDYWRPRR